MSAPNDPRSSQEAYGPSVLIREGATGPLVIHLQRRLAAEGFDPGPVDGIFGPGTAGKVRAFQRARGLAVDGIVGPRTWEALGTSAQPAEKPALPGLSLKQLRDIMTRLKENRAVECLPHLNLAMQEVGITTPQRQAAFLAQLAHESGELRYFEELASGEAYEGRKDLGNIHPGDGRRYKGRGPIQLTGRNNYRTAGRALGVDLENAPERAADVDVGFRVAAWYWHSRGLNELADAGNFREITRRINGGYNGLPQREAYHRRALAVLAH